MLPHLLGISVAVVALAGYVRVQQVRRRERLRADFKAAWGKPVAGEREVRLIAPYHQALCAHRNRRSLDDRTWSDLDFDAVFARLDRSVTPIGRQALYDRLRSLDHTPQWLAEFDALVESFRLDERVRLDVQVALKALDLTEASWLWSLTLEPIPALPRWIAVFPIFTGSMVALLVLSAWMPALLGAAVLGILVGGFLRARTGANMVPFVEPFRAMVTMLAVARTVAATGSALPRAAVERLEQSLPRLHSLSRLAAWLGRAPSMGDFAGLLMEYANLLFGLDGNALLFSVRELRRRQEDLHAVLAAIGEIDAAQSIASVRAGAARWTRPEFALPGAAAHMVLDLATHPLVEAAVANSIVLGPPCGALVTGANMTGKSTFLRTVGVNVILAQSIHTVFASRYEASWLALRSCITPRDDLLGGKSYYQAEVETIVAMLNDVSPPGAGLCLFDELFRGTNRIDRVAAAVAVLAHLARQSNRLVLAATHDLELVSALAPRYAAFHFGDRLTDEGLEFTYAIQPGPATSRNAIALLALLGAPRAVVAEARARAES